MEPINLPVSTTYLCRAATCVWNLSIYLCLQPICVELPSVNSPIRAHLLPVYTLESVCVELLPGAGHLGERSLSELTATYQLLESHYTNKHHLLADKLHHLRLCT
jgi:hypothetical protein